jgi:molecular chaperone HtpG
MVESKKSTYEFKAEIKKLLDILVNSLYTSKEIFIRELISNASDALEKIRFISLKSEEYADKNLPLEIKIKIDKDSKKLIFSDTGIGLTIEEAIENLGSIAKSGAEDFLKLISENKNEVNNIIGRFGVGFYSAFMVAKEICVKSKSYKSDSKPILWKSEGNGIFEAYEIEENIPRGTSVELLLKDDALEFLEKNTIVSAIKKHSNFISYPIYIENEKINTIEAIWRKPKNQISKDEYSEFYKFLTYDYEEPSDIIHVSVDAPIQYYALLFIPKKSIDFLFLSKENYGLDLYVKKVLIQHKSKDLLPEYLSFVKGIVDSEDLPLNISRETLQENIIFNKIARSIETNILNHLSKKAENSPNEYNDFWKAHGKILKFGYSKVTDKEKFKKLLRFNSSSCSNEEEIISLDDYLNKCKNEQKAIYFLSGSGRKALENDPRLEIFKRKEIEVLFLYDPVDEFILTSLEKYKDYEFKSIDQANLAQIENLEDSQVIKKDVEELSEQDRLHLSSLVDKFKSILGDKVKDVKISKRLIDSPACLINPDDTMSSYMQKIINNATNETTIPKKILEINPTHKIVRSLIKIFKSNDNDPIIKDAAEYLFETSLLMDGFLKDPYELISKSYKFLEMASFLYSEKL